MAAGELDDDISVRNRSPHQEWHISTWEQLLCKPDERFYFSFLNKDEQAMYNRIFEACKAHAPSVPTPVGKFTDEVLDRIFSYIRLDYPALFSLGIYATMHTLSADGTRVQIPYVTTSMRHEMECREKLVRRVNDFLKTVPADRGLSDIRKEKLVHDYILRHYTYDKTIGNHKTNVIAFTAYGLLVERSSVCEGVAKAARLLMQVLGVKSVCAAGEVKGTSGGHMWNIVYVDGKPYHLDITMDGGLIGPSKIGFRYDYFNVSDQMLKGNRTWHAYLPACKYDDAYIVRTSGGIVRDASSIKKHLREKIKAGATLIYVKLDPKSERLQGIKDKEAWLKRQYSEAMMLVNGNYKATYGETVVGEASFFLVEKG